MLRFVFLVIFVSMVSACGGSSGGGGTTPTNIASSSSSSVVSNTPSLSLGSDFTVNEHEWITITPEINNMGDFSAYQISQTEGPNVSKTIQSFDDLIFSFRAPDVDIGNPITLEFEVSVTNSEGVEYSDRVRVTVARVNNIPLVNAGISIYVTAGEEVLLFAEAFDIDGSVTEYLWQKTDGDLSVVLGAVAQKSLRFIAPAVEQEQKVTLEVTVTDNEGANGKSFVDVIIRPAGAPQIDIFFPPKGQYSGSELVAYGSVEAKNENSIESVSVEIGGEIISASVDSEGLWRTGPLVAPDGERDYSVVVTAVDNEGLQSAARVDLRTYNQSKEESGLDWNTTTAVSISGNVAWVLEGSSTPENSQLFPVNLQNGFRGGSVTNFADESQGAVQYFFSDMVFDADNEVFYLLTVSDEDLQNAVVMAIDQKTGIRRILSGGAVGVGESLDNPVSISLGMEGQLFVADNSMGKIVAVNINTGDREVYIDGDVETNAAAPIQVNWDEGSNRLFIIPNFSSYTLLSNVDTSDESRSVNVVSSREVGSGPDIETGARGLAIDVENQRAFILSGSFGRNLLLVSLETGERTNLATSITGILSGDLDVEYSHELQTVFVAGSDGLNGIINPSQSFYAVDPVTGVKVRISGNRY